MRPRSSSSGVILFTTLIDLLIQIVFLFMLIIAQPAGEQEEFLTGLKLSGLSISDIQKNWRRLVDIDRLEKDLVEKLRQNEQALQDKEEQLAKLQDEYDALRERSKASGGRDLPPCWVKDNTPEYLLSIEIREDSLQVKPVWEPYRDVDAHALELYSDQVEGKFTPQQFRARFGHLDPRQQRNEAVKKCSHYVLVTDDPGTSKKAYKEHLGLIESIFYKKLFGN